MRVWACCSCNNRIPNDAVGWLDRGIDIFHTSQLLNPPRRAKLTATVHDLTCWLLPETHSPANVAADQQFAQRILQRADGLIAVSERCLYRPDRKGSLHRDSRRAQA